MLEGLLFIAGTVFYLGGMVSYVAVPYQLYQLTGSNFAVGALGIAELVPLLVFGLYGGALADHMDRRKLLIGTAIAQVLLTGVLAWNAFLDDPSIWLIYAVGALLAAAGALQRPSKEAVEPRPLLGRLDLARVGRADGRQHVGEDQARLHEAERAVKLHRVVMKEVPAEARQGHVPVPEDALIRQVVDRQQRSG